MRLSLLSEKPALLNAMTESKTPCHNAVGRSSKYSSLYLSVRTAAMTATCVSPSKSRLPTRSSQRTTPLAPWERRYSAARSHSSTVADMLRLSIVG